MDKLLKHLIKKILPHKWVLRIAYERRRRPQLTIELTDRCNLACSYCPQSDPAVKRSSGDIDFGLFRKIIDDIASEHIRLRGITLVGLGEPLLYKRLVEAIAYIKKNLPGTMTQIITNGICLTDDIAPKLIDIGLDLIGISINSPDKEQYLKLNRSDKFDIVVQNTKRFLELLKQRNSSMGVILKVLSEPANTREQIATFFKMWEPLLCPTHSIVVEPFLDWAGYIKSNVTQGILKSSERYPCYSIGTEWIITKEGQAIPCCMVFHGQSNFVIGDVSKQSLREVFSSGIPIQRLLHLNKTGKLYDRAPCNYCNTFATHPNVWFKNPLRKFMGRKWL